MLAAASLACGGGGSAPADAGEGSTPAVPGEPPPPGSAVVAGRVTYAGAPPAPQVASASADAHCVRLHPDGVASEDVVVNADGTLRNVVVRVASGLERYAYPSPEEPVVLDQSGCRYVPHVVGVQVGQTLRILNSDPTNHNVHARSDARNGFNIGMPTKGDVRDRTFKAEEVAVKLRCDVHPWMRAHVAVVANPFFAVTGDGGAFELSGLPAGTYVVEAWHETLGRKRETVTVDDGGRADVAFSFP